nr:unnamed protein product [Callosobruchus chinensis]
MPPSPCYAFKKVTCCSIKIHLITTSRSHERLNQFKKLNERCFAIELPNSPFKNRNFLLLSKTNRRKRLRIHCQGRQRSCYGSCVGLKVTGMGAGDECPVGS